MKNTKRSSDRKPRNDFKSASIAVAMIAIGFAVCIGCIYVGRSSVNDRMRKRSTEHKLDIETQIRSTLTQIDIAPGFEPVAIYYQHPNSSKEKFCCIGTIFFDTNRGLQVVTAEHIFRKDIGTNQILSIRALRGKLDPPIAYLGKILATGRDLGGSKSNELDIVIATVSSKPAVFERFSQFTKCETNQNFWGEVTIGKKKIPRMRSLVSGKYVDTLGYARRGKNTDGTIFTLIECHVNSGESGSGYIDDYGGLWVVHAGTENAEEESQICEECRQLTGRKIVAISSVSGPLFGNYE